MTDIFYFYFFFIQCATLATSLNCLVTRNTRVIRQYIIGFGVGGGQKQKSEKVPLTVRAMAHYVVHVSSIPMVIILVTTNYDNRKKK